MKKQDDDLCYVYSLLLTINGGFIETISNFISSRYFYNFESLHPETCRGTGSRKPVFRPDTELLESLEAAVAGQPHLYLLVDAGAGLTPSFLKICKVVTRVLKSGYKHMCSAVVTRVPIYVKSVEFITLKYFRLEKCRFLPYFKTSVRRSNKYCTD